MRKESSGLTHAAVGSPGKSGVHGDTGDGGYTNYRMYQKGGRAFGVEGLGSVRPWRTARP